jgi:hypothetical protein
VRGSVQQRATAAATGTATGLLQRQQGTGGGQGVGTAAAPLGAAAGARLGGPLGVWTGTEVAWTGTGATQGPPGGLTGVAAAGCRHHQGVAAAAGEWLARVCDAVPAGWLADELGLRVSLLLGLLA